ncbi:hypothetical protein ACP275_09G114800 [Erythranthe tilingii]
MDFTRKLIFFVILLCVLISLKNEQADINTRGYVDSDSPPSLQAPTSHRKLQQNDGGENVLPEGIRYDYYNESCPSAEQIIQAVIIGRGCVDSDSPPPLQAPPSHRKLQQNDGGENVLPKGIRYDYYHEASPSAAKIIRSSIRELYEFRPDVAPALLRLAFHDCFVKGCDSSILLDPTNSSDKEVFPNQSLSGFDLIDIIKSEVEEACPGVVSCADIVVFAARESILVADINRRGYVDSDSPPPLQAPPSHRKLQQNDGGENVLPEGIRYDYYNEFSQSATNIIRSSVQELYEFRSNVAPALLRLAFHDCFVKNSLDLTGKFDGKFSCLLLMRFLVSQQQNDGVFAKRQQEAALNKFVRGFDMKSVVEEECVGVLSCSADDIAISPARKTTLDLSFPLSTCYRSNSGGGSVCGGRNEGPSGGGSNRKEGPSGGGGSSGVGASGVGGSGGGAGASSSGAGGDDEEDDEKVGPNEGADQSEEDDDDDDDDDHDHEDREREKLEINENLTLLEEQLREDTISNEEYKAYRESALTALGNILVDEAKEKLKKLEKELKKGLITVDQYNSEKEVAEYYIYDNEPFDGPDKWYSSRRAFDKSERSRTFDYFAEVGSTSEPVPKRRMINNSAAANNDPPAANNDPPAANNDSPPPAANNDSPPPAANNEIA